MRTEVHIAITVENRAERAARGRARDRGRSRARAVAAAAGPAIGALVVALWGAPAAAAGPVSDDPVEVGGAGQGQGVRLYGTEEIGLRPGPFVSAAGATLSVDAATGRIRDGAGRPIGLPYRLSSPENKGWSFEIKRSRPHVSIVGSRAPGTRWEYEVTWDNGAGARGDLCKTTDGSNWAIAAPGQWIPDDGRGVAWRPEAQGFSWSCVPTPKAPGSKQMPERVFKYGGVIAKCVDWGFGPDRPREHVACTRMALADYCGSGRSQTIPGTPIVAGDVTRLPGGRGRAIEFAGQFAGGARRSALPAAVIDKEVLPRNTPWEGRYALEAGWRVSVASGPSGPEYRARARCVSKLRWHGLPMGGSCPDRLPDPRQARGARSCDDLTLAETDDVELWSYSRMLDRGLFLLGDGKGRYVTSTATGIRISPNNEIKMEPAVGGYGAFDSPVSPQPFVGSVFTPDLDLWILLGVTLAEPLRWLCLTPPSTRPVVQPGRCATPAVALGQVFAPTGPLPAEWSASGLGSRDLQDGQFYPPHTPSGTVAPGTVTSFTAVELAPSPAPVTIGRVPTIGW